jgi:hypothetical protein
VQKMSKILENYFFEKMQKFSNLFSLNSINKMNRQEYERNLTLIYYCFFSNSLPNIVY